ncbi:MAG: hypothetical protein LUE96_09355 [Lachnospiraceae bacterium]|nr:hypothetical protein [Lachnospiraceae bacterium]
MQLKEQARTQQEAGNEAEAGAILELSQEVLEKREEIAQFARFDIPELIADMENAALAPEQAEAAKKYAQDMAKLMEVARRIAAGDKVPSADEKKLMEYDQDLYQTVKSAAMLADMKERKEYDSLWEDEEELEHTDMAELDREILDSELNMDLPEIDMSLLETQ